MPHYPSVLDLTTVNGVNGVRIDGLAAGDVFGFALASAGDVNGDGFTDFIIGAENADPGARSDAGETYLIFGSAAWSANFNLASLSGANGFRLAGIDAGDALGYAVAGGDINGDGFADLIIGATGGDAGAPESGEAYIIFGHASGWASAFDLATLNGANGFRINGVSNNDFAGWNVANAGDINGDGLNDILVSAQLADPGGDSGAGSTYIVFGAASGWGGSFALASLNGANGFRIDGIDSNDFSGFSATAAGDINGDGFDDVIVGAYAADPNNRAHAGETYVIFGHGGAWNATLDLAALNGANGFRLDGIDLGDRSGWSVANAGDINGDGYADIVVGAIFGDAGGSNAGEVYVVFGQASGWASSIDLATLNGANGFRIDGATANEQLGYSVAAAGDVNGDGFGDLVLGSVNGPAYIVFGAASGWGASLSVTALNGNNGYRLDGVTAASVSGAGDVNGDGIADMLIGSPYSDPGGLTDAGSAFLVFGARPGEAVTRTGTAIANHIFGSAFNDTLAGLGGDDILDGGAGRDTAIFSIASTSATWARALDGSWSVASAEGEDTLIGIEFIQFSDRTVFLDRAASNFFNDGASDILLRRSDGVTAIFSLNGTNVTAATLTQWQAGLEWSIAGIGDFNRDGHDDLLFRRDDGVTSIWSMRGANTIAADVTAWQAGLEWTIEGVGDFNGDGVDDFLWRRDDGVTAIWQMDGTNVTAAGVTLWQAGLEWSIAGIGDFNGDGRDDFLWQRDDGVLAIWTMDGATTVSADVISQQAGLDWGIAGVGDFNGDGRDDLLIRNADGVTAIFSMNGAAVIAADVTSQQAGLEWTIAAIGDYSGDGRDDILLRHENGVLSLWVMNGAEVTIADWLTTQAGSDWDVI